MKFKIEIDVDVDDFLSDIFTDSDVVDVVQQIKLSIKDQVKMKSITLWPLEFPHTLMILYKRGFCTKVPIIKLKLRKW